MSKVNMVRYIGLSESEWSRTRAVVKVGKAISSLPMQVNNVPLSIFTHRLSSSVLHLPHSIPFPSPHRPSFFGPLA